MAEIQVKRGYNLNLSGKPDQSIVDGPFPQRVAIRPADFGTLIKLRVLVKEGDKVSTGTPLMEDKGTPEIKFTSPATGTVLEVKRGERRALLQITIQTSTEEAFAPLGAFSATSSSADEVLSALLKSGLYARIRQHPYSKIPDPKVMPKGIFVSGLSTRPLGADPSVIVAGQGEALNAGLAALSRIAPVHLTRPASGKVAPELTNAKHAQLHTVRGKHPAGSAAVQIFYIDRVRPGETAWYLNIQDVLAIGRLALTGKLSGERIIALAGDGVTAGGRKLYRTRHGVVAEVLTAGKLGTGEQRLVSGDVLSGRKISASEPIGFYDDMLSVIPEGRKRELLGWLMPGANKYSYSSTFLSALAPADKEWSVDTNLHGGHRACIQCGYCNDVCPTDVLPLPTWKAVSYGDLEEAEQLGIADCVSCGLCTYVCPSKIEIDQFIHDGLVKIQKEG